MVKNLQREIDRIGYICILMDRMEKMYILIDRIEYIYIYFWKG